MPKGHFKVLPYSEETTSKNYLVHYEYSMDKEATKNPQEYEENFEDEFTAELEALGFLFPNYLNLKEDLFENANYDAYDFYNTISICKFDVIFPVSKLHPEVGAYAPCTMFIYKKRNENVMHVGFLGVRNWISTADIHDETSIKPLVKAEKTIKKVLEEIE